MESKRETVKPLSRAATETLAIVAYHQPVTRPEIEQIRGVSISKSTMDILVEEKFIKPGKRRDVPGRPLTWITTPEFLDHFGLETLNELPNMKFNEGFLDIITKGVRKKKGYVLIRISGKGGKDEEMVRKYAKLRNHNVIT